MKRITILLIMVTSVLVVHAQQGLHINELFKGAIIPQDEMMETRVRGKMIAKYQLSYYHSLRFYANQEEAKQIKELIEKDRKDHQDADCGNDFTEYRSKKLIVTSNKILLKPLNGKNRFICTKVKEKPGDKKIEMIVIYLEGSLKSLHDLETILKSTYK
ncbi:MAG: hypothetical protein II910_02635 [Prevotella sp.]|nr:hypothetical protein [Prevotella sp.]